ncbi:MAG: hypothetical protein KAI64_03885, partial [Thermoplasmata archaeon]|nr:hypothetical protein [Thermoplasmata archaeon]
KINGRINGLINGRGSINGLINGLRTGRINGLINGFRQVRGGLVNGLTNGVGITNGLGFHRFLRQSEMNEWKMLIIPLIAFILILMPVYSNYQPEGIDYKINIDGEFGDWADVVKAQLPASVLPNPNINIKRAAVEDNGDYLAFLIEVEGSILSGMPPPGSFVDTFYIFIDVDQTRATGYRLENKGIDYMIKVHGWQGRVYESQLHLFDAKNGLNDWSGWLKKASIKSEVRDNKLETQVHWMALGLKEPRDVDVYFYSQDYRGRERMTDFAVSNNKGLLYVVQTPMFPEIVTQGLTYAMLKMDMRAYGRDIMIEKIMLTRKGTASAFDTGEVTMFTEYGAWIDVHGLFINGNVSLVPNTPISIKNGSTETFFVGLEISGNAGENRAIGIEVVESRDISTDNGTVELMSEPPDEDHNELAYIIDAPSTIAIEGAFADWNNIVNNTLYPRIFQNDADIKDYRATVNGSAFSFFLETQSRMLKGTRIPYMNSVEAEPIPPITVADSDGDTVPDQNDTYPYDFNNDGILDIDTNLDIDGDGVKDYPYGEDWILETVIPDYYDAPYAGKLVGRYIGPVIMPPLIGEDTVYAYVDKDKNPNTGYVVNGIGADHLISISGKYGEILSARYFKYNENANITDWAEEGSDVLVETDYSRLEAQLNPAKIGVQEGDEFDMVLGTAKWQETHSTTGTKGEWTKSNGVVNKTFYLHDDGTFDDGDPEDLMDTQPPPSGALGDYDDDGDPGLTIKKGFDEDNPSRPSKKYQDWFLTPDFAGNFSIEGDVTLYLWSAMKDYDTGKTGIIQARLYDNDDTQLISSSSITESSWPAGDFQEESILFSSVQYTLPAGNSLLLRVFVDDNSDDDMWFAYNTTTYDTHLEMPTDTYVKVDWVKTYNASGESDYFSAGDQVLIRGNISDPFGSFDISGAEVTIEYPNGTTPVDNATMTLEMTDTSSPSVWKLFNYSHSLLSDALTGDYTVHVKGIESDGVIHTKVHTFTINGTLTVEPNNTGVSLPGTLINYTHYVNNTGNGADIYDLTVLSENGFNITIFSGGISMAYDSNGDGVWEYVNPSFDSNSNGLPDTDILLPGESFIVTLQVEIPIGTPADSENSTLIATSFYALGLWDSAIDYTLIPEFQEILIPIAGVLVLALLIVRRRRKGKGRERSRP